jgi:hypothetical protein
MLVAGTKGHAAVLGEAGLGGGAAEDGCIGGGDTEHATLGDSLYGGVEQVGGGTIGINVDHIEEAVEVAGELAHVSMYRVDKVGDVVALGVGGDGGSGVFVGVSGNNQADIALLQSVAHSAEASSSKAFEHAEALHPTVPGKAGEQLCALAFTAGVLGGLPTRFKRSAFCALSVELVRQPPQCKHAHVSVHYLCFVVKYLSIP